MAEITHLVKALAAEQTATSATYVEATNYTIAWSSLTTAGFAAGDDVIFLVKAPLGGNNTNLVVGFKVGFGTTYAGRTDVADSEHLLEPKAGALNVKHEYVWMDRRTLVDMENVYFSIKSDMTDQVEPQDFVCIVLKLDDLDANDFLYDEKTHSGDAPADYNTAGASVTTNALGDWWFIGSARWKIDSTGASFFTAIQVDGADLMETQREGEDLDTPEALHPGVSAYSAGLASSKVARVRFKVQTANTNDVLRTAIFGLRLDAFVDHDGFQTTTAYTLSAIDTPVDFTTGLGSFGASQTGDFMMWAQTVQDIAEQTRRTYGRIQVDGADWPSTFDRVAVPAFDDTDKTSLHLCNIGSITSGTVDVDFDVVEDIDVTPNYNSSPQMGIVFSMELAAVGDIIPEIMYHRKMMGVS